MESARFDATHREKVQVHERALDIPGCGSKQNRRCGFPKVSYFNGEK